MYGTTGSGDVLVRQSFPSVFSLETKPLKIGITQDILASHLDGAPDEVWIKRAIGYYVQSQFYLRCMKPGAYRFNIDGQPDGDVTEMEAASAKAMLIARKKNQPKRRLKSKWSAKPQRNWRRQPLQYMMRRKKYIP